MPKRLLIAVPTPVSVYDATQAFGSELRVHLIHHSLNTRALVETGVLTVDEHKVYSVNQHRFDELIDALRLFGKQQIAAKGAHDPR